jgi:hypothetical protein
MTTLPVPVSPGCDWPVDEGCLTGWDDLDPSVQERSVAFASATLRRLTGYRVGGCPITVRPCTRSCGFGYPSYYDMLGPGGVGLSGFWPHTNAAGLWVNSCGCATDCACDVLCEVALPPPVGRVDEVKLNGGIVVADQYRVDGHMLVWVGDQSGSCPWPACQDMTAADDQPDTFSVTYLNSYPVDTLGAYAAGVLAAEFAKACTGQRCRLPAGVTSISRQGVSMEIATGAFPGGVTGIREVDSYIALWNPAALRQQTQVWSPDLPRVRVPGRMS